MADRYQVALFLWQVKQAAKQQFRIERRPENMATLADLGITRSEAASRILLLTPDDYYRGPTSRDGRPDQEAWEFGLTIHRREIYVKLEVRTEPTVCLCISFHPPTKPITYPLRKS